VQKQGFSLNMYTEDELRQIHNATLEVFQHEGIYVNSEEALKLFEDGGAIVDKSERCVKIPPYMVEDAIRSAPSTVVLAGREPKFDCVLDGSRVNFTTFGAGIFIYDADTGEYRSTNVQDVADTARMADALDNVNIYSHAVSAGLSCPKASVDLHEANAFLSNTSKHCMHIDLTCGANVKRYIDMGAAIMGGYNELRERPVISALTCPTSPLQLNGECCEIIMHLARAGVPCNILSMAMSGGTAPITLAGTMVIHNCEVLGGIVLSQLAAKGAPVLYGSSTTTFDMMNVTAPVGSPELGMFSASVVAMAQFYMLPNYVAGG
jgi:trimethylamine--corrinoid protein Co-methyltransferase